MIKEKLFGSDDPLFPATKVQLVERRFAAIGVSRSHWSNTTPIRNAFKRAFARAGLPYFSPHSFRTIQGVLGQQLCRNPEEFKVWSQNLGHESPLRTLRSYGKVGAGRQAQVMHELGRKRLAGGDRRPSVSSRTQERSGRIDRRGAEAIRKVDWYSAALSRWAADANERECHLLCAACYRLLLQALP